MRELELEKLGFKEPKFEELRSAKWFKLAEEKEQKKEQRKRDKELEKQVNKYLIAFMFGLAILAYILIGIAENAMLG